MGVCLCGSGDYLRVMLQKSRSSAAWEEARVSTDSCDSSSIARFKHFLCSCNSLFQGIEMLEEEQQIEATIGVQKNGSISGEIAIHGTNSSWLRFPFEITDDELGVPGPQNSPVKSWWPGSDELGKLGKSALLGGNLRQLLKLEDANSSASSFVADEVVAVLNVDDVFPDDGSQEPWPVESSTVETANRFRLPNGSSIVMCTKGRPTSSEWFSFSYHPLKDVQGNSFDGNLFFLGRNLAPSFLEGENSIDSPRVSFDLMGESSQGAFGSPMCTSHPAETRIEALKLTDDPPRSLLEDENADSSEGEDSTSDDDTASTSSSDLFELDVVNTSLTPAQSSSMNTVQDDCIT